MEHSPVFILKQKAFREKSHTAADRKQNRSACPANISFDERAGETYPEEKGELMEPRIELPEWLESCRPDDAVYAAAYEGTPPEFRALLKTAIAFYFHRWHQQDGESIIEAGSPRTGFRSTEHSFPSAWALAVLGPGFSSPARFLSSLVPAVIAGTGRILIVSETSFSSSVATAMELAGLEDSFILEQERFADLYEDLRASSPHGRLLVFPGPDGALSPAQKDLLHKAAADGLPLMHDRPSPRLLSLYGSGEEDTDLPADEVKARLSWLHPDAELLDAPTPGISAVFTPGTRSSVPLYGPFTAGPGMEACWPGPGPEFFRTCILSAFFSQEYPL